jgi:hypothetical protein
VTRVSSRLCSSTSISSEWWSTRCSTCDRRSGAPTRCGEGNHDREVDECEGRVQMGGGATPGSVGQDVAGGVRLSGDECDQCSGLDSERDVAAGRDRRWLHLSPKRICCLLQSWARCPSLQHLRQQAGLGQSRAMFCLLKQLKNKPTRSAATLP